MKKVFYSTGCALALLGAVYSNANSDSELNPLQLKNVEALAQAVEDTSITTADHYDSTTTTELLPDVEIGSQSYESYKYETETECKGSGPEECVSTTQTSYDMNPVTTITPAP